MRQIALTDTEISLLLSVLQEVEIDLHSEIVHTDLKDYRDHLKGNRMVIHDIVRRLQQSAPEPVAPNAHA